MIVILLRKTQLVTEIVPNLMPNDAKNRRKSSFRGSAGGSSIEFAKGPAYLQFNRPCAGCGDTSGKVDDAGSVSLFPSAGDSRIAGRSGDDTHDGGARAGR
jgi:hypothetical protein